MNEKLVEYIAKTCNIYISDIRFAKSSSIILRNIYSLNPNLFSLEDWNKSLSYIFMTNLKFETSEDAKNFYVQELLKNLNDTVKIHL